MTAETDGEEDTQQRQLSDTPLLTRHSEVAREQKTQADRSSHSNMAHGQKRHNRHPQDRRQQPPLHVEVKRLQKEVTSLHAEMRHLEEHMDSLRETVINASEASSEAVRGFSCNYRIFVWWTRRKKQSLSIRGINSSNISRRKTKWILKTTRAPSPLLQLSNPRPPRKAKAWAR